MCMLYATKIGVYIFFIQLVATIDFVSHFNRIMAVNENDSVRIVALLEEGFSQRYVAERLGINQSTVSRIWNRFRETGRYGRRIGSGRGRVTTAREDRNLVRAAIRNPVLVARQIAHAVMPNRQISDETVRRRLHEQGLRSRARAQAPLLLGRHREGRRQYARNHANWTWREWRNVLFTDESRFGLYGSDGRIRVWRRRGQRFEENMIEPVRAFSGGSVMIWGGVSRDRRTNLVVIPRLPDNRGNRGGLTAERYINECLIPEVLPMRQLMGPRFVLMQDNARAHSAVITRNFLRDNDIEVLQHPAISPDLNPIEHVWDFMGRRLRRLQRPPRNMQELVETLRRLWREIPQDLIRACVNSMSNRLREVTRTRGGNTRY